MSWTWITYEEYESHIQPLDVKHGPWREVTRRTVAEHQRLFSLHLEPLAGAVQQLGKLGFRKRSDPIPDLSDSELNKAEAIGHQMVVHGEWLLLLDRRLSGLRGASEFHHARTGIETYGNGRKPKKLLWELASLDEAGQALLDDVRTMGELDEAFLVDDLSIPEALAADFRSARDLFAIGEEEFGLFAAARGLERVLREVHAQMEAQGERKENRQPTFNDMLTDLARTTWAHSSEPVLSKQDKALLDFARELRNSCAHGPEDGGATAAEAREKAKIMAASAQSLWTKLCKEQGAARSQPGERE